MGRHHRLILLALAAALCGCGSGKEPAPDPKLPAVREIDSAGCSPVTYGGAGSPDLLIGVSSVLQGDYALSDGLPAVNAIKLAFAQRGWKAGRYAVGLQVCDEVAAATGLPEDAVCAGNARSFAGNRAVAAVLGGYFSTCSLAMVGHLNRAPAGPLALVSGSNSYVGLTRAGPGVEPGEPERHYPTGHRSYARVAPIDDAQAAAAVLHFRRLGSQRLVALHSGDPYGKGLVAAFEFSAKAAGSTIAGRGSWDPSARRYRRLARRVAASGADGIFLAGYSSDNVARLLRDLRAHVEHAPIIASDGFADAPSLVEGAGAVAEGLTYLSGFLPVVALPAEGQRFAAEYEQRFGQPPRTYAVNYGQAALLVLDALGRSDGTRASIVDEILGARVQDGLTGDFTIDPDGDTSAQTIAVTEIRDGRAHYVGKLTPPERLIASR